MLSNRIGRATLRAVREAVATAHRPGWVAILFVALTAFALWPIKLPVVLGAWSASILRRPHEWLSHALRGRSAAAALVTVLVLVVIIGPLALLLVELAHGAIDLVKAVLASHSARQALGSLLQPRQGASAHQETQQAIRLAQEHGAEAGTVVKAIVGLGIAAFAGFFLFAVTTFTALVACREALGFYEEHAPLSRDHARRIGATFVETGRGLFASIGLTALTQGILVTITYVALGVPRALVLGFLTALFSVLPVVGTTLVWAPIAIAFFLTGHAVKGIILLAIGGGVIALVENLIQPLFARVGHLRLPTGIILLSMFGGVLGIGPSGIVLGPLFVRLAKESLQIAREAGAIGPS
jgi:predicted PurR-regulated permease PerM